MTDGKPSILPIERLNRTTRGAITVTVAAVLASGLLFNAGFGLLLRTHPGLDNPSYVAFNEQWRRLIRLKAPVETLIIGDSSGAHGVDPDVLDEALGTVSMNLCTMGDAGVTSPAWQLETYLRRFGAPRRVILVIVHDVWKRDLESPLIPRIPLPWGFWSTMRASWTLDEDQVREVFLARHVPVYSQDQTLLRILMHPWRGGMRPRFNERGFAAIWPADPAHAIEDFANHRRWTAPGGWSISESSREALAAMMAQAEERGFELYVVNSPQLAGMIEDDVFGPYYAQGQAQLAELVAACPRTHLVLSPPAEYPAESMQNSDHVAKNAVEDFTRRVAAAVTAVED